MATKEELLQQSSETLKAKTSSSSDIEHIMIMLPNSKMKIAASSESAADMNIN